MTKVVTGAIYKSEEISVGLDYVVIAEDSTCYTITCDCGHNHRRGKEYFTVKKGEKMMEGLKNYFSKNQDTIYTIGIVVLIDHFVFNGLFRDRLKAIIDGILNKSEKKLLEDK